MGSSPAPGTKLSGGRLVGKSLGLEPRERGFETLPPDQIPEAVSELTASWLRNVAR